MSTSSTDEAVLGPTTSSGCRATGCEKLTSQVWSRYETTRDESQLHTIIELQRQTLNLASDEHPDRDTFCHNLASSLFVRYQLTEDDSLLAEVIDLERKALELRQPGHQYRDASCYNLALSLWSHCEDTGDEILLGEAIDLNREALGLRLSGHPLRGRACMSLAMCLRKYGDSTENRSLIIESIDLSREALALSPPGHEDRPRSCSNLACSLYTWYHYNHDETFLTEIIDLEREALTYRPTGRNNRYISCFNLGSALERLYKCTGNGILLTEAIDTQREALSLSPSGHPGRAVSCLKLATSLWRYYKHTGDDVFLSEAVILEREAVRLRPPGHEKRGDACSNLALSLRAQYEKTGDESLMAEIIDLGREALASHVPGRPDLYLRYSDLASSLWTRYKYTGDEELLTESIEFHRKALRLCPPENSARAMPCANLALSLWTRYKHTRDESSLTEAIDQYREVLESCPPKHPNRLNYCSTLTEFLLAQFDCTGNMNLLIEASELTSQASGVIQVGRSVEGLHVVCENLSSILTKSYTQTRDEKMLVKIISLDRIVLNTYEMGHPNRPFSLYNLALSLEAHYDHTGDESLLTEAITLYDQALSMLAAQDQWRSAIALSRICIAQNAPSYNVSVAAQYLNRSLQYEPNDPVTAISRVMETLNKFWRQLLLMVEINQTISSLLVSVYANITTILPWLPNPVFDIVSQLQRLRIVRQVGADAFIIAVLIIAVLAGDSHSGLEHLEVAQGIVWAQRLHQRDPQLSDIPEALAAELERSFQAFSRHNNSPLSSSSKYHSGSQRDDLHKYSSRMYSVLRQIRAMPGLERFMLGEKYQSLCSAAAMYPVVALVGARDRFYALIIASGQLCGDIPLKLNITEEVLKSTSAVETLRPKRGAPVGGIPESHERGARIQHKTPLDHYLNMIWLKIVKPVLDVLKLEPSTQPNRPRLCWCPTGPFTSMPLHAAGIYDGPKSQRACSADYIVSSYTPTLTSLLRAQRNVIPPRREDLAVMLLAEHQAHPQENLPPIRGVASELYDIADIAASHGAKIVGQMLGSTTVAETSKTIESANIAHIACHGIHDLEDATRSGFCLGDGRLTISDLSKLDIKNRFLAFLSACETAQGSDDQPDQAMHLAAAMLFAGFKSVIATLWAISDEDGPKVAKWFYEELFAKEAIHADDVALALDKAVGQLRKSGVTSDRWVPFIHMGA